MIDVLKVGLPSDQEAERAVFGAILDDDAHFSQVAAVLSAEDFSVEKHKRIFVGMQTLYATGTRIDLVTLCSQLDSMLQIEVVGGLAYLSQLIDGLGSIIGVEHSMRIVKEKSTLRRYITGHQKLLKTRCSIGTPTEILERAERCQSGPDCGCAGNSSR